LPGFAWLCLALPAFAYAFAAAAYYFFLKLFKQRGKNK
jgi:hypothetical protein